jgi:hypothetical protein
LFFCGNPLFSKQRFASILDSLSRAEQVMSLMGGLVEHPTNQTVTASKRTNLHDWTVRHAWRLVVGFSAVVWLIVAALIAFH